MHEKGRFNDRAQHPEFQFRIVGIVRCSSRKCSRFALEAAVNALMSSVYGCDGLKREFPASKGYGCSGHGGSVEASETMFPKSAMFCDAGRNERMRNLHQHGPGTS